MIVGEHDQSFGDALAYARFGHLGRLSSLGGDWKPISLHPNKPVRIVKVVDSKSGLPVPGVQLNVVDEDRETIIYNKATDKNGVAILRVNYSEPHVSEKPRRNYIRTMLLPVGYEKPTPRTKPIDVSYYEPKPDASTEKGLELFHGDSSKLKPDVTIKVEQTGTPHPRVELTEEEGKKTASDLMQSDAEGGLNFVGILAFRIRLPDGKPAEPDPNTPYYYTVNSQSSFSMKSRADIDGGGVVWVRGDYPGYTTQFTVTPYFAGTPKPEWGFTRVLSMFSPYPYLYEIKHEKDGGLMPAGRITDEELGVTPVLPAKPPAATVAPGSGGPALKVVDKKTTTSPLPYILVGVLVIGAIVLYLRTKQD